MEKTINELKIGEYKFKIQVQQQLKLLLHPENLNNIIYDVVMIHHIKCCEILKESETIKFLIQQV